MTEMITGLDLVELQIRVAQGEKLPKQKDIKMEGHAIEARLYAEDPANDFLPSVGRLHTFDIDALANTENLKQRVDTGVRAGDRVSINYDPMIAKVIGYSKAGRNIAISSIKEALIDIDLVGLHTNLYFLVNCLNHPDFRDENLSTTFIPQNLTLLLGPDIAERNEFHAFAALRLEHEKNRKEENSPFANRDGWRNNLPPRHRYELGSNEDKISIDILELNNDKFTVAVNEKHTRKFELFTYNSLKSDKYGNDFEDSLNYPERWACDILDDQVFIRRNGYAKRVMLPSYDSNMVGNSANALTAPMPGKIIAVNAKVGDAVKAGDPLIIMEAMKMEMTLSAPRDGVVAEVNAAPEALVTDGEMLLSLEEENLSLIHI